MGHIFREISPIVDDFEPIEVKNFERKDLFITPFFDFELSINNDKIVEECLNLKKKYPRGVIKSNFGDGWQSEVYELTKIKKQITPSIQNLARNAVDLSNSILDDFGAEMRVTDDEMGWWININKGMGYNVYHTHPGCSIIGLYYPMIPNNLKDDQGVLTLLRSDPTAHNSAFSGIPDHCEWMVRPKVGHLYLLPSTIAHYVTPHFSNEERISIAFNIG